MKSALSLGSMERPALTIQPSSQVQTRFSHVQRLAAILDAGHFPHYNSKIALALLRKTIDSLIDVYHSTAELPVEFRETAEVELSQHIEELLPTIGFIVRSTNIRNAFEFYEPLTLILRKLKLSHCRLLISSEWEANPFIVASSIRLLPDFAVIGLPASESDNGLILPIAGHEIGHLLLNQSASLVDRLKLETNKILPRLVEQQWDDFHKYHKHTSIEKIRNFDDIDTWAPAGDWARSQLTEIFCDSVGAYLFGRSYLSAFKYFRAPNDGVRRRTYPASKLRAEQLFNFARSMNILVDENYLDEFSDDNPQDNLSLEGHIQLALADECARQLAQEVAALVKSHLSALGYTVPAPYSVIASTDSPEYNSNKTFEDTLDSFRNLVPADSQRASGPDDVAAILNAAWTLYEEQDPWKHLSPQLAIRKEEIINELILKSLEVVEFNTKTKRSNA